MNAFLRIKFPSYFRNDIKPNRFQINFDLTALDKLKVL